MEIHVFCSDHLGKSLYCESITCALNLGVNGCTELYCTTNGAKEARHFFYTFSNSVK